jgi:hypothetical protein
MARKDLSSVVGLKSLPPIPWIHSTESHLRAWLRTTGDPWICDRTRRPRTSLKVAKEFPKIRDLFPSVWQYPHWPMGPLYWPIAWHCQAEGPIGQFSKTNSPPNNSRIPGIRTLIWPILVDQIANQIAEQALSGRKIFRLLIVCCVLVSELCIASLFLYFLG